MRQASYAARNAALLQRGTPHAARKSARVFLHSAQPPRAASCLRTVQAAFFCRTMHAACQKYPLKAQSHPAQGCTRSSAKAFSVSQSRDISRRFQRALSKFECRKLFRSSGAKYSLSSSFSCFFGKQQQITHHADAAPAVQKVL